MNSNEQYWCALPAKELVPTALEKVRKYYSYLTESGRLALYRLSWAYYYRARLNGGQLQSGGSQGELTVLSINNYRNLLSHLESMTTQQRVAFEPKATNSDAKSQSQVILAKTLLDYYMREKKLEKNLVLSVKEALIYGEAFVRVEWDAQLGEAYAETEEGNTVHEGDIKYTNYNPVNVIRDYTAICAGEDQYYILRDFVNKYDLAARYPELSDDILSSSEDMLNMSKTTTVNYLTLQDSDKIPVYTLIHDKTPALPNGRYIQFIDNGAVFIDGPLPYELPHVYRIAMDEEDGTIFGYTVGYDLLPQQQIFDILHSTVTTNQSTFGVQNIMLPTGSNISPTQVAGGMNLINFDPKLGEPKALNLTQTPAEIFNYIGMIDKAMETTSGVNSVARGNPEASLKSGAALALVQSQAVQFNQNLQRAYAQMIEDIGTGTINLIKDFASTERVAQICGKTNLPYIKKYTGQDLSNISRVLVDMGSPMSRTTAGKIQIAETLMQNQLIKTPEQYIQVLTTGTLDPLIEGEQAELILIKGENEALSNDQDVRALITDNHKKHIQEHTCVLANPNIRNDANNPIVAKALAHIQEHMNMMNDPNVQRLAAILHQENVPAAPQSPPAAGSAAPLVNPASAEPPMPNQPNMPSPPQNTDPRSAQVIEQQANLNG